MQIIDYSYRCPLKIALVIILSPLHIPEHSWQCLEIFSVVRTRMQWLGARHSAKYPTMLRVVSHCRAVCPKDTTSQSEQRPRANIFNFADKLKWFTSFEIYFRLSMFHNNYGLKRGPSNLPLLPMNGGSSNNYLSSQ